MEHAVGGMVRVPRVDCIGISASGKASPRRHHGTYRPAVGYRPRRPRRCSSRGDKDGQADEGEEGGQAQKADVLQLRDDGSPLSGIVRLLRRMPALGRRARTLDALLQRGVPTRALARGAQGRVPVRAQRVRRFCCISFYLCSCSARVLPFFAARGRRPVIVVGRLIDGELSWC